MAKMQIKAIDAAGKVRIFGSVAEAAKALNTDASNIGKVLRGKRQKAGGYSFSRTLEPPTTKKGREARRAERVKSERKAILSEVHDTLKELNQRYRNARKENVYQTDEVLKKLMSHTDYFGQTKTGGYDISMQNLRKYSNVELENLQRVLRAEEKKYTKIAERKARPMSPAALAGLFGISQNEVDKYKDVLPYLFDLLHLAREDQFFKYSDIQDHIWEAMKNGIEPEKLMEYIDLIYEAYADNNVDALDFILNEMTESEYQDNYD